MSVCFAKRHITYCATEDLKAGKFSYSDAGQMHLYLNYAREHCEFSGRLRDWASAGLLSSVIR